MKIYLGIDIGGSEVKLAAVNEACEIVAARHYPSDGSLLTLESGILSLLSEREIPSDSIEGIAAAGVGAPMLGGSFHKIPVHIFGEFEAFGRGGLILSGKKRALVASMGTGTAFVYAENGKYVHLGGSGVGGGTLSGLSRLILGEEDISRVSAMTEAGSAAAVDLTVGDISEGECTVLDPDITAANFGRIKPNADKNDLAAGIANMIFQTAGVMAGLACRNTDIRSAVFVGSMALMPTAKKTLADVGGLYDMEFIVPENAPFAGALGAAAALISPSSGRKVP